MLPRRRFKNSGRVCIAHREWIKLQPCCVCGRSASSDMDVVPAHLRIGTDGGTALKPSDRWLTPLCVECHNEQHGGERSFWEARNVDPHALATRYAERSPHREKLL